MNNVTVFGREDGFVGDAFLRVGHDVVDVLRRRTFALLSSLIDPLILSTHTRAAIHQSSIVVLRTTPLPTLRPSFIYCHAIKTPSFQRIFPQARFV